MLKKIFLPFENSPFSMAALNYACFIASRQNAVVTGGIFIDIEKVNSSLGTLNDDETVNWHNDLSDEIISLVEPTVEYLIHSIKQRCIKNGIKYSFEKEIGMPGAQITRLSNYYDIVVTGLKSDFGLIKKNSGSAFLKKILTGSATSILAVPNYYRAIRNVVVAYDSSISASRALQRFVHLANFSELNITIITSSNNSVWAEDNIKRAKEYLLSYGASNVITDSTHIEIIKVLQSSYFSDTDLIVLGSHSQSIKDIFIGSVTEKLINDANKPLLIGI